MRMNYSDAGVFDNSHKRYRVPTLLVGEYGGYALFDNGIAASKKGFINGIDSGPGIFNNSTPVELQRMAVALVGMPTMVSYFDNGIKNQKEDIVLSVWSGLQWFDNSIGLVNVRADRLTLGYTSTTAWYDNGVNTSKQFVMMSPFGVSDWFDNSIDPGLDVRAVLTLGACSPVSEFNNAYDSSYYSMIGEWSTGVFDLPNNIAMLMYDEYNYDAVKADLVWPDLTFNWFDNSIPSIGRNIQHRLIPWGYRYDNIQFSINFPEAPLEHQVDIPALGKEYDLDVQVFGTPPIATDEVLELQSATELDKYHLEIQLRDGVVLDRLVEVQLETKRERTERLNKQWTVVESGEDTLDVQSKMVYKDSSVLEISNEVAVEKPYGLGMQYKHTYNDYSITELQLEVLEDRIELLQIQQKNAASLNYGLELGFTVAWDTTESMEVEFVGGILDGAWLEVQYEQSAYIVDSKLEVEFYGTPPIDYDNSLELQSLVQYTGTEVLELEWNVDRFIAYEGLEHQWLQSAKDDQALEVTFMSTIEAKISTQAKLVPWGYGNLRGQMALYATLTQGLELGFDTSVDIDSPLEVQIATEVDTTVELEECVFVSIEDEDVLEVQVNASELTKEYEVGIQYTLNERIDKSLEQCAAVVIEMDSMLEVCTDTIVTKSYVLETQIDVSSIWKDEWLDVQYDVGYITVDEVLDIQYDVLDLVYYMLYNGYNLVPWWSDGLGHWDQSLDKDWDKDDLDSTMADNLVAQLNDLELDVEVGEMIDVGTRNFMYYRELLNTTLSNKVLKLLHKDADKKYLTLGKSKKDKTATIEFKVGDNVFFYDGKEEMFNAAVRDQLGDKLVHTLVWKPQTGEWERFTGDREVYFYEDVNGKEMPMPYVFIVNVSEDCEIEIKR